MDKTYINLVEKMKKDRRAMPEEEEDANHTKEIKKENKITGKPGYILGPSRKANPKFSL